MKLFALCLCTLIMTAVAFGAMADDKPARATKEEAVAFVKRAVDYLKTNGSEKAFPVFSDPKGPFVDRDLYLFVSNASAICLATGTHQNLIGKSRIEQQDADGLYFMRDRVEKMKTETSFWANYKYPDPITHKILPKSQYCEVADDPVQHKITICAGVYTDPPAEKPK